MDPDLMNMVTQVEGLPPEVIDLVMHRKKKAEAEQQKAQKEQTEQLSNYLEVAKSMNAGMNTGGINPQAAMQMAQAGQMGGNPLTDILGSGFDGSLGI